MRPHMAKRAAWRGSFCLAGMMPGESSSSKGGGRPSFDFDRTQPRLRVTPARSSDFAALRPARRLMSADFPTFG